MSSDSKNTIAVTAFNFERYPGATGVRLLYMGNASRIQDTAELDLEETICQVMQRFPTDLRTTASETTIDEKLKTILLPRKTNT